MSTDVPLIRARGLQKSYDDARVRALRGVDLDLRTGEFVALMGPSGCGKSTLLQILGTLDSPDAGTLELRGRPYPSRRNDVAAFRAREVGFVFQSFHLLPALTALENVQVPMMELDFPRGARSRRALELLASVGLESRALHRPAELAGGERQRVAIARALANAAPLILADEPTGNLDSDNARWVLKLLRELHRTQGCSVVIVTHDAEVARWADRVIWMRDGQIVPAQEEVLGPGNARAA